MTVQKLYLMSAARPFLEEIGIGFEQLDRPSVRNACLLVTNGKAGITLERSFGRHVVKDTAAGCYVAFPDHMVLASVRTHDDGDGWAGGEVLSR